jgi:hypothetical protein
MMICIKPICNFSKFCFDRKDKHRTKTMSNKRLEKYRWRAIEMPDEKYIEMGKDLKIKISTYWNTKTIVKRKIKMQQTLELKIELIREIRYDSGFNICMETRLPKKSVYSKSAQRLETKYSKVLECHHRRKLAAIVLLLRRHWWYDVYDKRILHRFFWLFFSEIIEHCSFFKSYNLLLATLYWLSNRMLKENLLFIYKSRNGPSDSNFTPFLEEDLYTLHLVPTRVL